MAIRKIKELLTRIQYTNLATSLSDELMSVYGIWGTATAISIEHVVKEPIPFNFVPVKSAIQRYMARENINQIVVYRVASGNGVPIHTPGIAYGNNIGVFVVGDDLPISIKFNDKMYTMVVPGNSGFILDGDERFYGSVGVERSVSYSKGDQIFKRGVSYLIFFRHVLDESLQINDDVIIQERAAGGMLNEA